ncbi:transposase [Hydrocoleum sp. CS-953]|uniref:transposase n=1 Tax=Hydrocoleum sp. CS-953 TaxID=1671698 RepID=UPI00352B58E8
MLDGVNGEICQVSGDGAYDKYKCYEKARQRGAKATIPPRKNAVIGQHGNCKSPPHPRDENLRRIRKVGRKKWKRECGYHARIVIVNYNVPAQIPLWREVTTTKI